MTDANDEAHIHLSADEAIVLFELLSKWAEGSAGAAPTDDPAEIAALDAVQGQLERQLVAPLKADYAEILKRAKTRLRGG